MDRIHILSCSTSEVTGGFFWPPNKCAIQISQEDLIIIVNICWLFQVSVIGLSSTVSYPRVDKCLRQNLVPFTDEAKMEFLHFIEQLQKQTCKFVLKIFPFTIDLIFWRLPMYQRHNFCALYIG